MNTFLCNKSLSNTELKYKLKYSNLIDIEPIVSKLKNSTEYSLLNEKDSIDMQSIDTLFHTIFSLIFKEASIYVNYFDEPMPKQFFGFPACDKNDDKTFYKTCSEYLVKIKEGLLTSCITNGLINTLACSTQGNTHSTLSAKYHNYNSTGFFADTTYNYSKHKLDASSKLPQVYNSTYKRLHNTKENYYTTHLLDNICIQNENNNFLNVPIYIKNIALFLLNDTSCSKVSKSILSNSTSNTLLTNYNLLYESCANENGQYNTEDQFLFTTFMEYYFGFSSIKHIENLLEQIKTNNYNIIQNGNLKASDLFKSNLPSLLSLVLNCPALAARDTLLDYATFMLTNTRDFDNRYFNTDVRNAIYFSSEDNTINPDILIPQAQKNFKDFFAILNNYTIPLLNDLWYIITTELFIDSKHSLFDVYKIYINEQNNNMPYIINKESDLFDINNYDKQTKQNLSNIIIATFNNNRFKNSDLFSSLLSNYNTLSPAEKKLKLEYGHAIERYYVYNNSQKDSQL